MLSIMGQICKDYKCGSYLMYKLLFPIWKDKDESLILSKVKLLLGDTI